MTASFLSYLLTNLTVHAAAWFALVSQQMDQPAEEGEFFTLALLYLFSALLLQLPLGGLSDRMGSNGRWMAAGGALVTALGVLLAGSYPEIACIVLGLGTALSDAGGLTDAATQNGGITRIGLFLSVIMPGIALGKKLGNFSKFPAFYFVVMLCFCALLLFYFCRHSRETFLLPPSRPLGALRFPLLPSRWVCLPLAGLAFTAILFAGQTVPSPGSEFRFAWLVPAAACCAGMILGGVLADLFGAVLTGPAGLLLSLPLFLLGKERFLFYAGGLFFLSFALPAAAGTFLQSFSGKEGRGLALLALGAEAAFVLSVLAAKEDTVLPAFVLPLLCGVSAVLLFCTAGRQVFRKD